MRRVGGGARRQEHVTLEQVLYGDNAGWNDKATGWSELRWFLERPWSEGQWGKAEQGCLGRTKS